MLYSCANQHVGIRGAINSWQDYDDDYEFGWVISHAWDAEDMGWQGIVKRIRETVGDNPVYSTSCGSNLFDLVDILWCSYARH